MAALTFNAIVKIRGINPYILVSKERAAKLRPAWRRPMPVLVQVNGQPAEPWHINMMPTGTGSFYLYLHGDVRKASGTKVGDKVAVKVDFDAVYTPMPQMPSWFAAALAKHPAAKTNWARLTPSRQKEILRYLNSLKSDEARKRNADKAIKALLGQADRFMARSWQDGSDR